MHHFGECNPERSAVRVIRNEGQGLAEPVPVVCQQCDAPACGDACPADAIFRDPVSGLVEIMPDACTGCGECTVACPAGCIFLDGDQKKAVLCDLCGGEPRCVPMCHSGCLQAEKSDTDGGLIRVERLATLLSKALTAATHIRGDEK